MSNETVMAAAKNVAACWEKFRWSTETSDAVERLCATLATTPATGKPWGEINEVAGGFNGEAASEQTRNYAILAQAVLLGELDNRDAEIARLQRSLAVVSLRGI